MRKIREYRSSTNYSLQFVVLTQNSSAGFRLVYREHQEHSPRGNLNLPHVCACGLAQPQSHKVLQAVMAAPQSRGKSKRKNELAWAQVAVVTQYDSGDPLVHCEP